MARILKLDGGQMGLKTGKVNPIFKNSHFLPWVASLYALPKNESNAHEKAVSGKTGVVAAKIISPLIIGTARLWFMTDKASFLILGERQLSGETGQKWDGNPLWSAQPRCTFLKFEVRHSTLILHWTQTSLALVTRFEVLYYMRFMRFTYKTAIFDHESQQEQQ